MADSRSGRTRPRYRRYALTRGDDTLVVDLVRERVHQVSPASRRIDGVFVDPPEEIIANKLERPRGATGGDCGDEDRVTRQARHRRPASKTMTQ